MTTLIEEIQRDAFDEKVTISALLRKVRAAAVKLCLPPAETWVEHELNGYPAGAKLPDYRELAGKPMALNPYRGWIPIILGNTELDYMLSTCPVRQSVASIEAILRDTVTTFVQIPLSPGMITQLNDLIGVSFGTMAVHISTSQVHGLLDAVRNTVLEWALKLERAGVKGEGLSFSREERQMAKEASTTINIGSIGSMVGNLGSNNATGDVSASRISVDEMKRLTDEIAPYIESLKAAGADSRLLQESLAEIKRQSQSATVDQPKALRAVTDLRNALSGAGGSIIASGALTLIAKIFGA
ncbi:hypothetical protein V5279_25230 [Bradyrhizobium sp. 26S5]|uniref:AbiTii domain-containing protein n=1 Tax=Bradyrhizobium sp. 26S5 TaxID=3139729 RepID=UPI0030D57835